MDVKKNVAADSSVLEIITTYHALHKIPWYENFEFDFVPG